MSAAELKEMLNETKRYLDHVDEDTVKMVHDLLEAKVENDTFHLTTEQEAELDRRMALDKKGSEQYSSWEEVKERILSKKRK